MSAALAALLVLPLLLRLVPRASVEDTWRTPAELALALACGVGVVALADGWLAGFHLREGGVVGSDFAEYCLSTDALRDGAWERFSMNRSRLVGLLPGLLARRVGVIDGLAYGAGIGTAGIGAGLYLWGRALHGRVAGIAAALMSGAVGPLVLLPRTLSFYPETVACYVWCAAGAALAMRYRTPAALLAGGIGTALALLADARGLLWALPALGLSLLACIPRDWRTPRAWAWLPPRIGLVLLPVALSYPLGSLVSAPNAPTLEVQVRGFQTDRMMNLGVRFEVRPLEAGFLWGHSDPLEIPATLATLAAMRGDIPASVVNFPETVFGRRAHVEPWYPALGGALLVCVLGLARRPWQLAALLGTALPFFVVLKNAADFLVHLRYLQTPTAAFPVILGTALAALALGRGREADAPGRWHWRVWARPAAAAALALLLVLGGAPTWLSPVASWRQSFLASQDIERMMRLSAARGVTHKPDDAACLEVLIEDIEAGHPAGGRRFRARRRGAEQPPRDR